MPYVVRFAGYRPIPRETEPWTSVRIEEAPAASGPFTVIETLALTPDEDPNDPRSRTFETQLAQLADGWYRVTWLDAGGDEAPTDPVRRVPWAPSVDEVAAVTPLYTSGDYLGDDEQSGALQGTYTGETEPTRDDVEKLIAASCEDVLGRVGNPITDEHHGLARATAKWHAAAAISGGKIPADSDDARGEYRNFIGNYAKNLERLIELCRPATALRLV